MGETKSFGENVSEEEQENALSATLRSSEKGLSKLNTDEIAKLREMIIEEENRDIVKDLLDLASVFLKDESNKEDLEAFLQFIKNEIEVALIHGNFQFAHKTLKGLHSLLLASKTEKPWAISIFKNFIKTISDSRYLNILSKILPTLDKTDLNRFKLMRQFLVQLHSNAILTLGPMLSPIRSISVQRLLLQGPRLSLRLLQWKIRILSSGNQVA